MLLKKLELLGSVELEVCCEPVELVMELELPEVVEVVRDVVSDEEELEDTVCEIDDVVIGVDSIDEVPVDGDAVDFVLPDDVVSPVLLLGSVVFV